MAADEVTFLGTKGFRHHNNPSGTEYNFYGKIPLKVKHEDALWYAEEATRGGPWKVDLGIVGQAAETIREAAEVVKPGASAGKGKGGKK